MFGGNSCEIRQVLGEQRVPFEDVDAGLLQAGEGRVGIVEAED
jgi:hypothetical protein